MSASLLANGKELNFTNPKISLIFRANQASDFCGSSFFLLTMVQVLNKSEKVQIELENLESSSLSDIMSANLLKAAVLLDLSEDNTELEQLNISDTAVLEGYIKRQIAKSNAKIAWGGYLENRTRYASSELFSQDGEARSVHLGIDVWAEAGTAVFAPLNGRVHSFKDNRNHFDYGPTIILEHRLGGIMFHTLYGHLSSDSLDCLEKGRELVSGALIGKLGTPDVNGDWPSHLHFQVIIDMQGLKGDYPGVAAASKIEFYRTNCPDPNLLLNFPVSFA